MPNATTRLTNSPPPPPPPPPRRLAITKWALMQRLVVNARTAQSTDFDWWDSSGIHHRGRLDSIQREDGSGSSFNVTIDGSFIHGGAGSLVGSLVGYETFHLRTVD